MRYRGAAGVLALLVLGACDNRLPTLPGGNRFPGGAEPTTVELTVPASGFLLEDTVHVGFSSPREAPFLLVANEFDGELDAHSLTRFGGFPDSVTVGGTTDTAFTFTAGQVIARVQAGASFAPAGAELQLWTLDQPWDAETVSWDTARAGELWRVPGGTPGRLLAEAVWMPGDTIAKDTVRWQVDSLAVIQMASEDFPGLLVTSSTPGVRVQLGSLSLQTGIRAASRPDTVLARTFSSGVEEFIFTPPPPRPANAYQVGGITEARTVLRLDLGQLVPACADPENTPDCPRVPLREVTLNRAALLLEPLPVPAGFRPLQTVELRARRVIEPELGRLAPLGELLALDSIPAARFAAPDGGEPVALDLSGAISRVAASDSTVLALALLGPARAGQFGYLWFAEPPRLRLVYTLPMRPQLP